MKNNFIMFSSSSKGPSENDCKSCSKGFEFNVQDKQCLSICPNGNYFDQNDNVS